MRNSVHELFDLPISTEEELKLNYAKAGEHLYISPDEKLDLKEVDVREAQEFQVIFPMGGEGTRLLHITRDNLSKHMVEIGGQPLSKYTFDLWRKQGFSDFCFLIDDGYRGKSISQFFGQGERFGTRNRYSIEHTKLGTGGSIKEAIINGNIESPFIMHYPDDQIVAYDGFPRDFLKVIRAVMEKGYQVVVVCVPGTIYPWGEVCEENGRVVDFSEKPFIRKDSYIGVSAISRDAFPLVKALDTSKGAIKIERTLFKEVARSGRMFKVLIPYEYWFSINDDPGLRRFEQVIKLRKKTKSQR